MKIKINEFKQEEEEEADENRKTTRDTFRRILESPHRSDSVHTQNIKRHSNPFLFHVFTIFAVLFHSVLFVLCSMVAAIVNKNNNRFFVLKEIFENEQKKSEN